MEFAWWSELGACDPRRVPESGWLFATSRELFCFVFMFFTRQVVVSCTLQKSTGHLVPGTRYKGVSRFYRKYILFALSLSIHGVMAWKKRRALPCPGNFPKNHGLRRCSIEPRCGFLFAESNGAVRFGSVRILLIVLDFRISTVRCSFEIVRCRAVR